MAFVGRSENKIQHLRSQTQDNVGPGSYNVLAKKQGGLAFAPFNSSISRDKKIKQKDIMPGPGQYQQSISNYNEKVVVSSDNENIKIVEVPKPSSFFKSSCNRFQKQQINNVPGPSSYDLKDGIQEKAFKIAQISQQKMQDQGDKKDLLETIMNINRYRSIPSIPSKGHSYGYTENKQSELKLNKIPLKQHTGIGPDQIGPGHYQTNETLKDNGPNWHKYKSREEKQKPATVGPGQYDLQTKQIPLYKMKQSSGFASQSQRTFDQKKGKLQYEILKQKQNKEIQGLGTAPAAPGSKDQNWDNIDDYVEDQTPAPWQYHNEAVMTAIKVQNKEEKFQFFGSSADRFQQSTQNHEIGPGQYNSKNVNLFGINNQMHPVKVKNPPFLSSNTRFQVKSIIDLKPAPGQYENKINTLEEKLTKKIQKGYRGNFGTSEKRFIPGKGSEEVPGPGQYIDPIQEKDEEDVQPTYQFKSVQKREIEAKKSKNPPVGAYNVNFYDMNHKLEQQEEEDPENIIRKPGFGSSAPRFKAKFQQFEEDTTEDTIQQQGQNTSQISQKNSKNVNGSFVKPKQSQIPGLGFNNKDTRFKYKVKEKIPGPGQYFGGSQENQWNKRTFNILYSEI